jgi:hypothetical protein
MSTTGMPAFRFRSWTLIGKAAAPPTWPESDSTWVPYAGGQCKEPSAARLHCVPCATLSSGTASSVQGVGSECPVIHFIYSQLCITWRCPGYEKDGRAVGLSGGLESEELWTLVTQIGTGEGAKQIRGQPPRIPQGIDMHILGTGDHCPSGTGWWSADDQPDRSLSTYTNRRRAMTISCWCVGIWGSSLGFLRASRLTANSMHDYSP